MRPMSGLWVRQVWLVLQKDLRIEARTGEIAITGSFFAVLVTVIASLAFYTGPTTRNQVAAGVIWLATCFSAVLSLSRTWQRERDEGMLEALIVSPLAPSALFLGKALGVFAFLGVVELIVIPASALFFSLDLFSFWSGLFCICLAATPGVAAAGTLFGVMTARTRARDLVLSVVLFPLLSPTLLGAAVATRELLSGTPFVEILDYIKIMLVFDFVFITGGLALFGSLAEQ